MSTPANLYPGLNELADVIEKFPMEVARNLTLLREIDAKCVHAVPELEREIEALLTDSEDKGRIQRVDQQFQDLMPSLEEKMHVSALACEALEKSIARAELAYEVALKNQEIPEKLRLGNGNHPAMHLHYELMKKIESKQQSKSQQALRSESRREAMAARRQQHADGITPAIGSPLAVSATSSLAAAYANAGSGNGASLGSTIDGSVRRRQAELGGPPSSASASAAAAASARRRKRQTREDYSQRPKTNEYGEALYCYCNQIAYGEMVGCDGENCQLEWFHLPCINLETLPKGKWYCDDCKR
ncbi:HFL315Cp [Eremothecium sinecaudum]|uniref:Chromatin modification-related protein n=1 Tax=Eremothecium sinecaudum TaxID=45286 RepID=A0A120K2H0_9SACH|nr:HFL315Cp [Eremothecium sinecaudum]AMD21541.1 HFL315Cp [Eremothecium sinecaudum]